MGSIPLVWVAPLSIYLSTFILAYRRRPSEGSFLRRGWPELLIGGILVLGVGVAPSLLLLFIVSLASHTELHRVRPKARELTFYYLVVSAGGWAGAAFVSLAAPSLFGDLHEWPLALLLVAATLTVGRRFGVALGEGSREVRRRRLLWLTTCAATAGVLANLGVRTFLEGFDAVTLRNPFGLYRITSKLTGISGQFDDRGVDARYLLHGATVHGMQLEGEESRRIPVGYYHRATPIGDVLGSLEGRVRVGLIGLGTGTVAAYFDEGDEVAFYELDPDGEAIARAYFSYLDDSPAEIRVVVGDARLGLARDPLTGDGSLDLIFVDAFNGGAVPAHLLTREAFELYLRKLRPEGLLLLHLSSAFYDLNPVVKAAGESLGLHGVYAQSTAPLAPFEMAADAYALARSPERLALLRERGWQSDANIRAATLWTDDYVNILAPLWSHVRASF